jgi:hypothetical protein
MCPIFKDKQKSHFCLSTIFHCSLVSFPPCTSTCPSLPETRTTTTMDSNRKKKRQTHIVDDAAAIGLSQQKQGHRKHKKRSGAPRQTAPKDAGNALLKSTSKAISKRGRSFRYYEQDGLTIPLYEENGKKRPHARVSSSLRNKSLNELLDIVEKYAGTDEKRQLRKASTTKAAVADWIEEVETRALGANPKSRLAGELKYQASPLL